MADMLISRREFLHLSLLGSCLGLSGCTINPNRPTLSAYKDLLPKDLIEALPSPWNFRRLNIKSITDTSYLFDLYNKSWREKRNILSMLLILGF